MVPADVQAIERAVPLVVRDLTPEYDAVELIAVTGHVAASLDVQAAPAQLRTRLAAAAGAYLSWMYPPAGFKLGQAAFGRMWWHGSGMSLLDIVVIEPDMDALSSEATELVDAGVTVRLVFVEAPAHTRTFRASGWNDGWEWQS